MAKVRLSMDDLRVDSFAISSTASRGGTVYGREIDGAVIGGGTDAGDTCYATCYGKYTCAGQTMCENTCYPSSPHICC